MRESGTEYEEHRVGCLCAWRTSTSVAKLLPLVFIFILHLRPLSLFVVCAFICPCLIWESFVSMQRSRNSIVDIAARLRLRRSGIRILARESEFALPQSIQFGSRAHPALYLIGTVDNFQE